MNDEGSVFEAAETAPCTTGDLPQTENEGERASCGEGSEEASARADEAAADVLTDPCTDPDLDCQGADPEAQASELEQLRGELKELREELAARNARMEQDVRVEREYAEFCELFPDLSIRELPDEVWQDVKSGTSLAAAYALAEKKRAVALGRAKVSNAQNRARSVGAVRNAQNDEFSPAEVRAMTSAEVRANLPKIMRSMQKWH